MGTMALTPHVRLTRVCTKRLRMLYIIVYKLQLLPQLLVQPLKFFLFLDEHGSPFILLCDDSLPGSFQPLRLLFLHFSAELGNSSF